MSSLCPDDDEEHDDGTEWRWWAGDSETDEEAQDFEEFFDDLLDNIGDD